MEFSAEDELRGDHMQASCGEWGEAGPQRQQLGGEYMNGRSGFRSQHRILADESLMFSVLWTKVSASGNNALEISLEVEHDLGVVAVPVPVTSA
jgi:hypothetical protein